MHLAVLMADYAGTVVVSNRMELRGRETEAPPPPPVALVGAATLAAAPALPNPGLDLVDVPSAHVVIKGHAWDTTLDYSAFAILPDLETGQPVPQLLHTGYLGGTYLGRTVKLGLFEYAQFGEQNSAYLSQTTNPSLGTSPQAGVLAPPTSGTSLQLLASPVSVLYGSSRTDLTSQVAFSRRWLGTTLLEYAVQGGADAASRAIVPLVQGPRAEATFKWIATRTDAIESKITGAHSDASPGPCFAALINPLPVGTICGPTGDTLQWTETVRHKLSRQVEAWIGAGPAFVAARLLASSPFVDAVYPAVLGGFQYLHTVNEVRTVLRLDAQVAPLVDVRSGIVDDRAQGALSLQVPFRDVTLTSALSGTRSVVSLLSQPVESVQGSVEIEVRLDPELSVGGGARYVWQDQAGFGTFSTGLAFLQATFRTRTVRF